MTTEVVDYSTLLDPHYPDQPHEERQGDPMGPMGGFVDLLSGTKLTNMLTLTLPIPLCEFSDLCEYKRGLDSFHHALCQGFLYFIEPIYYTTIKIQK